MESRDIPLRIPDQVVTRKVGEETVILDFDSGTYFGLDPVGSRFLELLDGCGSVAQVIPRMLDEFDVTEEQLASDLLRLTEEMLSRGLLERG